MGLVIFAVMFGLFILFLVITLLFRKKHSKPKADMDQQAN